MSTTSFWAAHQVETPTPTRSTTGKNPRPSSTPGFAIALSCSDDPLLGGDGAGLPGVPLWAGLPTVRIQGDQPHDSYLTAHYGAVRLFAIGQRLPPPHAAQAALESSVTTGDFDQLGRWPGSCTVLVLGPDQVLVYPDLAGQFPVYYTSRNDKVILAQHATTVAAITGRSPDPLSAMARIACAEVPALTAGRSAFAGVARVEGGTALRVTSQGVDLDVYRNHLSHPERRLRDCAADLRESLQAALAERCAPGEGQITADFSGGVDSTTIAMLAAGQSRLPLRAVVYHHAAAPTDDLSNALHTAALHQRIRLSRVEGDNRTLPYQNLLSPEPADEPATGLLASNRAALRLDWAVAAGSQLHLTGEGGDALLWSGPSYLTDLAPVRLWKDCSALARLRGLSAPRLVCSTLPIKGTSATMGLVKLARALELPDERPPSPYDAFAWWRLPGEVAGWLRATARRDLADLVGDPATREAVRGFGSTSEQATLTALREAAAAQRFLRELGHRKGVSVHAPLLDNEVVRICLSLPAYRRADVTTYKPLLRNAVEGLVPVEVTMRTTKGNYLAEEYQGARRARGELLGLLEDARLADLGVIEPKAVKTSLYKLINGAGVPTGPLNRLLAWEVWLRSLESSDTEC